MSPSSKGIPARLVACCTASSAFALALLTGLFVGNDLESTVSRGLAAMVVCYVVGRLVGWAFEALMRERLEAERALDAPGSSPAAVVGPGDAQTGERARAA